ncbi:MAG: hypothetical protein HY554_14770 [Elusimicrobia bacterium]|nr:hypothetical protein [Elusimicrobiota bacterium]
MGAAAVALAVVGASAPFAAGAPAEGGAPSRLPAILTPHGLPAAGASAERAPAAFVVEVGLKVRDVSPALAGVRAAAEAEGGREDGLPSSPVPGEVSAAYRFPPGPAAAFQARLGSLLPRLKKLGEPDGIQERLEPSEAERKSQVASDLERLRAEEAGLAPALVNAPRTARLLHGELRRLEAWTPESDPREGVLRVRVVERGTP